MQNDFDLDAHNQRKPSFRSTIHTSFVLRCQINQDGEIRARLLDVRTGRAYPLATLDILVRTVAELLTPLMGICNNEEI